MHVYVCMADASTDAQILEKGVKSPGVRVIVLSHLMWVLESAFKFSPKTVLWQTVTAQREARGCDLSAGQPSL